MPNILVVEDEAAIADTLVYALKAEGFSVSWLQLATPALEHIKHHPVDLIILDVGLPDLSGFELCKRLRRVSDVPIVFLTARGEEVDRVVGLEIGADDYVVKPFSPRELTARVKAVLKRLTPRASIETPSSQSTFVVNAERLQISYRGQPLNLTPHEFRLLQWLIENPDRVFSREQLLNVLGVPVNANYDRSIDSHIKSLRAKLRKIASHAEPIQTHRGFGYSYSVANS